MNQAILEPNALPTELLDRLVADNPKILTAHDGRPLAALINYELYLALEKAIGAWYTAKNAGLAHEDQIEALEDEIAALQVELAIARGEETVTDIDPATFRQEILGNGLSA